MKNITIQQNDANQRLDRFLSKLFPQISRVLFYKLIRKKQIRINNQRTEPQQFLKVNDVVTIRCNLSVEKPVTDWSNVSGQLDVVYEDSNVIIVNKPTNLNTNEGYDNLEKRIRKYLLQKGEFTPEKENTFQPAVAHRLDQNTAGLVICAKTATSLRELNTAFQEHWVKKTYRTVVYGLIQPEERTIQCYLRKQDKFVDVFKENVSGSKIAITSYRCLEWLKNKYSLLDVEIQTGRTHQIRATLNWIGYPIVGEQKYIKKTTDRDSRFKHQLLCAYKLQFNFPKGFLLSYLNEKIIQLKKVPWII